jgi:AraC-like DNA-binding protein
MALFQADAAQALFGLDLARVQDRFAPAHDVMGAEWKPMWDDLHASRDDDIVAVFERHLARRWQATRGRDTDQPSLRQLGRNWVERLAWQAHEWRREHSPRHVERRVKSFSGRSLREWQAIVRTEGLFFAARDRHDAGQPFDWATLALDEGFADQAHMTRAVRRISGFTPAEFARRFAEDESFWVYRLWV